MQQLDSEFVGLPWYVVHKELQNSNIKYIHCHTKPPKDNKNLNEKTSYVIRQTYDNIGNCIIVTAYKMDRSTAAMTNKRNVLDSE